MTKRIVCELNPNPGSLGVIFACLRLEDQRAIVMAVSEREKGEGEEGTDRDKKVKKEKEGETGEK
jgi:hypothetical protein